MKRLTISLFCMGAVVPFNLCAVESEKEKSLADVTEVEVEVIEVSSTSQSLAPEHSTNDFSQTETQIQNELIHLFGSNSAEMMSPYVANVQVARIGAGMGEDYTIRGFNSGGRLLLDGILDNQSYYRRDAATYESVRFEKGHNSALYGAGSPGGAVNFISKKPEFDSDHTLTLALGNKNYRWLTFDSTGRVNNSKQLAYRSILSTGHSESWKKNVSQDPVTLLNALTWKGEQSQLTATWEYSHQDYPYDFDNVFAHGKPVYGVSYVHPESSADNNFNRLELQGEHWLTNSLKVDAMLRGVWGDRKEKQIGFYYLISDDKPLKGYYRDVKDDFSQTTAQVKASQAYMIGRTEQESVVGVALHKTQSEFLNYRAVGLFDLDIYNPQFNFELPSSEQLQLRAGHIDWQERAYFFQQNSHIANNVKFTIAARYTDYLLDRARNNYQLAKIDNNTLSYSTGLGWSLSDDLKLRSSYSRSWLPNSGLDQQENYFSPSLGAQYELGVNWALNSTLKLDLALFNIEQTNLLVKDPQQPEYYILAGEKHAVGAELNIAIALSEKLSLNSTSSILRATLERSYDQNQGNRFAGVPKLQQSLLLNYRPIESLSTSLGLIYQSRRPGDLANSFWVDSFTRVGLAAKWQLSKKRSIQASVHNLANTDYVSYATAADFLRFGEKRMIRVSVSQQL